MRGIFAPTLAFAAALVLALPPSACCLFGADRCCASAAKVTPVAPACHVSQGERPCCKHQQSSRLPADPPAQVCCCVKTAVPISPVVSPDQVLAVSTVDGLPSIAMLAATHSLNAIDATVNASVPLHVRLCVWRL